MEHDLLDSLPSEMMMRIFARLSLGSVGISKCVCKPWLDLLESDEFVKSHFAKSVPVLMESYWSNVFELEGEYDRHNPLAKFVFPHRVIIEGSTNGLLLLGRYVADDGLDITYVCNPVTREFIEIDCCERRDHVYSSGIGTSKKGGEHKVVHFHHGIMRPLVCRVYTIGTGLWRSVEVGVSLDFFYCTSPATVDGNLHWVVSDSDGNACVCCFDLETECLSTFGVPTPLRERVENIRELSVLSGCLCLSDNMNVDVLGVWLMKEYGKSWSKVYEISSSPDYRSTIDRVLVYPLKVYENGDMLMLWDDNYLFYYSNETKTTRRQVGFFGNSGNSVLITPSFFSLKRFEIENVISI